MLDEAVYLPEFNYFHVSSAYHSLAKFHRKGVLQGLRDDRLVFSKLHIRAKSTITSKQINPQACANVLWAVAVLFGAIPAMTQLLQPLIKVLLETASGMNAQGVGQLLVGIGKVEG